MQKATIKFFNDAKGWGFATTDSGEDIFVHHSAIQMKGRRTLVDGQRVELEYENGAKGLQATRVFPE